MAPAIAPLVAAVWFWAIAYESVTAYRGMILVPREYDLSLDPPSANYAEFFLSRFLTVAALLLLALIGIRSICRQVRWTNRRRNPGHGTPFGGSESGEL